MIMEWITNPEAWFALLTLTALEIILGIDNIVDISVLAGKLPEYQRELGRLLGLLIAMIIRILLLFSLNWLINLTTPLFDVLGHGISGQNLILVPSGLFLIGESIFEIHELLEREEERHAPQHVNPRLSVVLIHIMLLDGVFSLDSVITAIGMTDEIIIMIIAIVVAVLIMLISSGPINNFVYRRPTIKILALSFLLLIGFSLISEGLGIHIPQGYIYFAMGFAVFVQVLTLQIQAKAESVKLKKPYRSK